ncbi:uncharacterized protein FA14DRAFT_127083 [Meira miltonrushii]|uniref:Uncharacterized protein n=1 Tax=Meira miltonrushii TaxID=1280837 RepID=A0A316V3U6_9BASI|nr:uncharacterized protein FA14DRAFT_127083 [Meira miltonrushii]PWN31924.1 hypothetical protein FA14DRAFT_127083 [Meira miltonrushii]
MQKQVLQVRDASCAGTGALYVEPAGGITVDSAKETKISWNPACLDPAGGEIDIYLYAPQQPSANLPIHAWTHIPATTGSFPVKLAPVWWNVVPNTTSSVELSLNIVPTGNQPWDTANPFGPTWTATYTAPANGESPPKDAVAGSEVNKLVSIFYKGGHITAGGKAAAIICPLIVLFVAIGIFVRKLHINRNNKTADWADHMDKRMSQISLDWQSGGDGSAGPMPGSRPASFMGRPQSAYRPSLDHVRALYNANLANGSTSQTNLAGMGANIGEGDFDHEMSEAQGHARSITDSSFARQSQYRASRVSFAPSTDVGTTQHGHASARGHSKNSASIPRVGANSGYRGSSARDSQFQVPKIDPRFKAESHLRNTENFDDDDELMMSPTQEEGARPLNLENVRRSIDDDVRNSMLRYPALEMVTNNGSELHLPHADNRPISGIADIRSQSPQDYLRPQMQTGMLPPSNATSPDDAMRQYAAQRAAGGSPMPSNTMRTLYSAAQPQNVSPPMGGHRAVHSIEASTINEDDVVGYNEMIDHSKQ